MHYFNIQYTVLFTDTECTRSLKCTTVLLNINNVTIKKTQTLKQDQTKTVWGPKQNLISLHFLGTTTHHSHTIYNYRTQPLLICSL